MASEVTDLPLPDSPTMPTTSPGLTAYETPSTAWVGRAPLPGEGDAEVLDLQQDLVAVDRGARPAAADRRQLAHLTSSTWGRAPHAAPHRTG